MQWNFLNLLFQFAENYYYQFQAFVDYLLFDMKHKYTLTSTYQFTIFYPSRLHPTLVYMKSKSWKDHLHHPTSYILWLNSCFFSVNLLWSHHFSELICNLFMIICFHENIEFGFFLQQVCNLPDGIQTRWPSNHSSMQTRVSYWLWQQVAKYQQSNQSPWLQ